MRAPASGLTLFGATARYALVQRLDRSAFPRQYFAEQESGNVSAEACLWRSIRYALAKEAKRCENVIRGARL